MTPIKCCLKYKPRVKVNYITTGIYIQANQETTNFEEKWGAVKKRQTCVCETERLRVQGEGGEGICSSGPINFTREVVTVRLRERVRGRAAYRQGSGD